MVPPCLGSTRTCVFARVKYALTRDIDVLFGTAGKGRRSGVRSNFETNVFAPLDLAQKFVDKWINEKRRGKVLFTSSMVGSVTPPGFGIYDATKHALEAMAPKLCRDELKKSGH